MREYYVDDFKNKKEYKKFIEYMLENSDFFSFIYFKEKENAPVKKSIRFFRSQLQKYKIYSKNTMEWPNTQTFDTRHIYNMAFYYAKTECLDILCQVKCLYDWDYPDAPMDLCFYKDGYCWFAVTAHEGFSYLYTDDLKVVKDLKKLGVNLEFKKILQKYFILI
ncbi:MAG: hypothetical protein ACLRTI_03865 [Blautia sp.]